MLIIYYGCALGCANILELARNALMPQKWTLPMLRDLILDLLTVEIKKEFSNIFSNNWPNVTLNDANNSVQAITPAPISRDISTMIDDLRPLFYSPTEQRLLDYITENGSAKQDAIIAHFKAHDDNINESTVKALLANLKHRRALITGNDGYEVAKGV